MRPSAEIGSAEDHEIDAGLARELHADRRRCRAFCAGPAAVRAIVAAIVEHTDDAHVAVALRGERADQASPRCIGADDDGAAVEPALSRPVPHQQEQRAPEREQRHEAEDVKAAEPHAREMIAGLGEERHADRDQEDHRPGRGEPEILLLVAAERLHLIDVGGLECEHGKHGDRQDAPT